MQKQYEVKVNAKVDDGEVKGLEQELKRIQNEKIQLKINAKNDEIKSIDSEIESLKMHINALASGKIPIDMDLGAIAEAQDKIDALEGRKAQLMLDVEESELRQAQAEIEELDGRTIDVDINNVSTLQGIESIKSGIDGVVSGASEAKDAVMDVVDVSANFEQNQAFLEMNIGPEKAASAMDDIAKIVQDAPGDDLALNSILVASKAKEASLSYDDMSKIAYTAADYMQGMVSIGKNAVEAQQDMRSYIIAGNTAEIARSPILQEHIDKLEAATTPLERQKALQEALKEEGYDGIANQDTFINKQAAFEGALERSKKTMGDMFKPLVGAGMDAFMTLNEASGGVFGAIGMGIAGLAGPALNTGLSVAQLGASIKTISGEATLLGGVKSIFGGLGSSVMGVVGKIPLIGGALSGLSAGPVILIIAAIVALGVAIFEVGKSFGWWTDVSSMFEAISAGAQRMWSAFMNNEGVIMIIDQIKDAFGNLMSFLGEVGGVIAEALGFDTMGGEFDIVSAAINFLGQVGNAVLPVISGAIHYVKEACAALAPVVMWVIQNVIIPHFQGLYTVAMAIWPYISQAVSTAIGIIRGVIAGAMAIWTGLQGAWRNLQSTASSVFSAINGIVSGAGGVWNGFKSTVTGVINGVMDKINALKDAAAGIGDSIKSAIGMGGLETPTVSTPSYGAGGSTTVTQGNTIIFNMYGDVRDEKTLDDMIDAINSRVQFDALANGVTPNEEAI